MSEAATSKLAIPFNRTIAVVGLGYVGLPVAVSFGLRGANVIGFDISQHRIKALKKNVDLTLEVNSADLKGSAIKFTDSFDDLKVADFYIITVPTPIDAARRPDLGPLLGASSTVGKALNRGDIVVYESTVYPGATQEECIPTLEKHSGLKAGVDFFVGYSPERINPGDKEHRFETIRKVVSGMDKRTAEIIAAVYGAVVEAGVHIAPSIKVAEAAKVIENTQRDINIAFMNELSEIFFLLNIDTQDVLKAASTKWNFLNFTPGLVGGHCIGVDPYYLTYRAEREGYHPQVILAGRRVNDGVGVRVAHDCIRLTMAQGRALRTVTILGVTFKEDVPDLRNSRVMDIVETLKHFGIEVQLVDPLADSDELKREYGYRLTSMNELRPSEAVILAVPHAEYRKSGWALISALLVGAQGVVLDVKGILDRSARPTGVELWRL